MPEGELHAIGDTLPELYVFFFILVLSGCADAGLLVWYLDSKKFLLPTSFDVKIVSSDLKRIRRRWLPGRRKNMRPSGCWMR
jgi:hypothetical protein